MDEKTDEKLNLLKQTQAKLKDVSHQQQTVVEYLADRSPQRLRRKGGSGILFVTVFVLSLSSPSFI